MHLKFCQTDTLNVGDDLNTWLWPKLIPELLAKDPHHCLIGIGTLLNRKRLAKLPEKFNRISVLSSGAWGPEVPNLDPIWTVYGVRGPLTASWMGLDKSYITGDGAYLLRQFTLPSNPQASAIAFIPHHASERYLCWEYVCQRAGLTHITPCQPVDDFLRAVAGCKLILAEAMHGAIIADVLRIPWIPVRFSPTFQHNKWLDWLGSIGREPTPFHYLPHAYQRRIPFNRSLEHAFKRSLGKAGINRDRWSDLPVVFRADKESALEKISVALEAIAHSGTEQLSTDLTVAKVTNRLQEAVHQLKQDS